MNKLVGSIMMGAGILIAGVSGLCSLIFAGEAFGNPAMARAVVTVGLLPLLVGVALFFGGRKIRRRALEAQLSPDREGGA